MMMSQLPFAIQEKAYEIIYEYVVVDSAELQHFLAKESCFPAKLMKLLLGLMLELPEDILVMDDFLNQHLKYSLSYQLLPEGTYKKLAAFKRMLGFIDKLYQVSWNSEFLAKVSRCFADDFLIAAFKTRLLSSPSLRIRTSLQYLSFIAESITSKPLAKCIFDLLFTETTRTIVLPPVINATTLSSPVRRKYRTDCELPSPARRTSFINTEQLVSKILQLGQQGEELLLAKRHRSVRNLLEFAASPSSDTNNNIKVLLIELLKEKSEGCSVIALQVLNRLLDFHIEEINSMLVIYEPSRSRDSVINVFIRETKNSYRI